MISIKKLNKRYFLAMLLSDFLFLFSLSYAFILFIVPALQELLSAADVLKAEMADMTAITQLESAVLNNEAFIAAYHQTVYLFVQFLLVVFVAWLCFKSLSWFFSHKSFLKKIPFWSYLGKFCYLSGLSFVVLLVILVLSISLIRFSASFASFLFFALLLLLLHFSQVSLSLIPSTKVLKSTFTCGVRKRLIAASLINLAVVLVAFWLWSVVAKLSAIFGVVFLFVLPLPALAFCRFHYIVASWQKS